MTPAMLSTAQAATRVGRGEETIRRWIRQGRLRAHKSGGRLYVHSEELDALVAPASAPLPATWAETAWGTPQPDWVAEVRRARGGRRLPGAS